MGKCDDCQNHFERKAAFSARTQELYDLLIKPLRYKAKSFGYALALHGTINYDIDLVAIPWREKPCSVQSLVDGLVNVVKAIHYVADEKLGEPTKMPEGRLGYIIHLSHDFGNGPYIDLSVIQPREVDISNFPRTTQNQTVSSGVEGAHEGTTADKSGCGYCGKPADDLLHTCRASHDYVDHDCHSFRAGSREPEKLNNAPISEWDQEIPRDNRFNGWVEPALAESSLSSPPPELNMTRADDGRPQFLWFGGKYYTIEHPECMEALLKAIREFPTVPPTPIETGAESVHSGERNTADKSGLLPTQLPKEK